MKRIILITLSTLILAGCSSKPPALPEPEGPWVKVNINQPHEKFGENRK